MRNITWFRIMTQKRQVLFINLNFSIDKDFIRIGSKYRLKGPQINIRSHFIHPLYGQQHRFDYDVQLLELYRSLSFGKTVSAIKISDGVCGDDVSFSGWGYDKEKGDYQDVLKQVKIQVVPLDQCQEFQNNWYNHTLTSRMFCAGDDHGDACQGDSGGGAVSYSCLVGLSSFGYGCGRQPPGVYVNVSHPNIRLWIRRFTGL